MLKRREERESKLTIPQDGQVQRACNQLEPLLIRMRGADSLEMAQLMRHRARAYNNGKRFDKARALTLESLRISEALAGGEGDCFDGLIILAEISYGKGDYEIGLEQITDLRSRMQKKPDFDFGLLGALLEVHALLLAAVERFEEALIIWQQMAAFVGMDHPNYARSCLHSAQLFATLKQTAKAVREAERAFAIRKNAFGESHTLTREAQKALANYTKALTDPDLKKQLASKLHRLCNIDGCNTVEEKMGICLHCNSYYLCKDHIERISEHMPVCPKHPDALWVERKLVEIVKCRRCRKETKLMKCSVCDNVSYCGAKCQKEDWKRHKVFCGKK